LLIFSVKKRYENGCPWTYPYSSGEEFDHNSEEYLGSTIPIVAGYPVPANE
jgi:hypothetical protein